MNNIDRAKKIKMLITDVDGVLTDGSLQFFNPAGHDPASVEIKNFYSLDGIGLMGLKFNGIQTAVITGGPLSVTGTFARIVALDYVYHGFFAKLKPLEHLSALSGIKFDEMAFVGDDIIDLPILKRVGLACVVPNAARDVDKVAHYKTENPGGHGAIREVCEFILRAQGKWDSFLETIENGTINTATDAFKPQQKIFSKDDLN